MQDRLLATIVRVKQMSYYKQPLFDFNSLLLNDNTTKKNQEVAVGGQRSDGFGAFFRCGGASLRRIGWLSETFWLKQVVVHASNVQKMS